MGKTYNSNLECISLVQNRIRFIELGAFSHLEKLIAIFGNIGPQGVDMPSSVLTTVTPQYVLAAPLP